MFCNKCGANLPDNTHFCPQCGAALGEQVAQSQESRQEETTYTVPPQATEVQDTEIIVKRIKDNAKLCAILWIVVGALQCLSCVGIIAGVWNIVIGVRELKFSETIAAGKREIYTYYNDAMNMIIIGGVINLVFGLLVGCALTAFEYYIRDQVIKNKAVFSA